MNRETIIQMAREAGLAEVTDTTESLPADYVEALAKLCALAVAKEAESRKAAQAENADLKERLARSGIEQRRAVAKEREECAKVCESTAWATSIDEWRDMTKKDVADKSMHACAAAIRARGEAV